MSPFPFKIQRQLPALLEGHFLKRSENILAFGLPGQGETHLVSAIGHKLILRGHTLMSTLPPTDWSKTYLPQSGN
ncbi:MAG: hypothetical protein ACP5VS_09970 [Desulfomonilaceae bacterium]